jgi:hypothetical protein
LIPEFDGAGGNGRKSYGSGFIATLAGDAPDREEARGDAIVALSTMIGAMTLARVVADSDLSSEILDRAKSTFTGRSASNFSRSAHKIPHSIHEVARDLGRVFAHLKRIIGLERLRLRGPSGAREVRDHHLRAGGPRLRIVPRGPLRHQGGPRVTATGS